MLAQFRRFLNTRAARVFFVLLIIPFVSWGVADVARNSGRETSLATVGDRKVETPEFQDMYRRMMADVSRRLGGRSEPTPAIRRAVAGQALDRLVMQTALAEEVARMGVAVPDEALRREVFEMPALRGPSGQFERRNLDSLLRTNNLTEGRFLEYIRADLGQRQLIEAVQVGARPSELLVNQVYAFAREQRVAELVELPFAAAPEPPASSEDDLKRFWENDPGRYSAPAYRRIKAVILSPDTIARTLDLPEPDLQAWYQQHRAEFGARERRTVQVVVSQDEAAATRLAETWRAGADWAAIQEAATAASGSSVQLDDAARAEIPGDDLAGAVFAAASDTVTGPVRSAFGYQVLRVTKITPDSEQPFEAVRDQVQARLARERAVDLVYARANKLEDALSAGGSLDELPGDLGLGAVTGTLDAQGNTPEGTPAPLPGTPALRTKIIADAFAMTKGEPPRMIEGPDTSYYALAIEDQTASAVKPFETVRDQVAQDYEQDVRRRAQEAVAARLLAAVRAGGSLDDAATIAGLRLDRTPPIGRAGVPPGVPPELVQPLFALKVNEATMVSTPLGYLVARLATVETPDPASDPDSANQLRSALTQQMAQDIEALYTNAIREKAKPRVNAALLETLVQ